MIDKIRDFFKDTKVGKQAWHSYRDRIAALPPDYRLVMNDIQAFMWNIAMDAQVMAVFYSVLDLFEEGAADGRRVLDVTGDDVAEFALGVLQAVQAETWTSKKAKQLNDNVHKQLAALPATEVNQHAK